MKVKLFEVLTKLLWLETMHAFYLTLVFGHIGKCSCYITVFFEMIGIVEASWPVRSGSGVIVTENIGESGNCQLGYVNNRHFARHISVYTFFIHILWCLCMGLLHWAFVCLCHWPPTSVSSIIFDQELAVFTNRLVLECHLAYVLSVAAFLWREHLDSCDRDHIAHKA